MILLLTYAFIALGVSFLCSIAEAVILSVTSAHVALLEQENHPSGALLRKLREDINRPLAAILTLNTIAHTVGAAGTGAQAAVVFGSTYVGVASAILTLLILVLSEIIPKTLGAHYWKPLSSPTAYTLKGLIWALYPFVKLSEWLTRRFAHGPALSGFNRDEMAAMAMLSTQEGQLSEHESRILLSLLRLRDKIIETEMTPRTVVFSLSEELTVEEFVKNFKTIRFSRIPLYAENPEDVTGFVLRSDILLAHSHNKAQRPLKDFVRPMPTVSEIMKLTQALKVFLQEQTHMMLVLDEYGGMAGILTLEDVLECLIGREIIDEGDETADMRELAKRLWRQRAKSMGIELDDES